MPPEDLLRRLLAEDLPPAERSPLEAHLEGCPHCQQALEHLTNDSVVRPAPVDLSAKIEAGPRLRVKLTDFGLARAADDASITHSGVVVGRPLYMSPEQARGEALDHRSDLFSLGSVLYAITLGRPPFRAGNTLAILKRVAEETPRPIPEFIPETSAWT